VIVGDDGTSNPYKIQFKDGKLGGDFYKADVEVKLDLKVQQILTRCVVNFPEEPDWESNLAEIEIVAIAEAGGAASGDDHAPPKPPMWATTKTARVGGEDRSLAARGATAT